MTVRTPTTAPPESALGTDPPIVVLVHGALDRGDSFGRVTRRLPDYIVVSYDRRGYQRSRTEGPPADLPGHIADLLDIVDEVDRESRRVTAVGHSLGGDVVMAAALTRPEAFASIAVFEPPMPWLPLAVHEGRTWNELAPAAEAERFFRRMVGDAAWTRLSNEGRASRQADGTALVGDLRAVNATTPFDPTALRVPMLAGVSEHGRPRQRAVVDWLVEHVADTERFEIAGATHGAHLSHPDAFASFVRHAVGRGIGSPDPRRGTAELAAAGAAANSSTEGTGPRPEGGT